MKYLTLIVISTTLFLQGCKAQTKIMENQKLVIPEIDKKFEKFDVEEFNNRKKKNLTHENINDSLYIYTGANAGYSISIYPNSTYFGIVKNFYKQNANIQIKGISFNNGSQYGIWYEFDEQGNLIKETDTDEGYDFGWKQVIGYCEKNKIELTKGYEKGGYQTTIYKEEQDEKKVWEISYLISPVLICKKILDGKTGGLIEEEELEFINH